MVLHNFVYLCIDVDAQLLLIDVDSKVDEKLIEDKGHMGQKLWVCRDCGFSRQAKWDVKRHIEQKHLEMLLHCQVCSAVFRRRDKYKSHLKKHANSF